MRPCTTTRCTKNWPDGSDSHVIGSPRSTGGILVGRGDRLDDRFGAGQCDDRGHGHRRGGRGGMVHAGRPTGPADAGSRCPSGHDDRVAGRPGAAAGGDWGHADVLVFQPMAIGGLVDRVHSRRYPGVLRLRRHIRPLASGRRRCGRRIPDRPVCRKQAAPRMALPARPAKAPQA